MSFEKLFVYGTLRTGGSRNQILDSDSCVIATVQGELFDLGTFPGAKFGGYRDGKIVGEIHTIDSSMFRVLDVMEAEGILYERVRIKATTETGEIVEVWAYEFLLPTYTHPKIASGDYFEHISKT